MNEFAHWNDCLSDELVEQLWSDYVDNTPSLKWTHRMLGRFTYDVTGQDIGKRILQELITRENSPWYQDTEFESDCAIWLQCFVPGSFLATHREKSKGVSTIYLNKQQMSDESGFIRWFEHKDPDIMWADDQPVHKQYPKFNCGNYWKPSGTQGEFNPWHYVHRNNETFDRFSIQIFREESFDDRFGVSIDAIDMLREGYLEIYQETTAKLHYPEDNDVFGYGVWHPEIITTWARENSDRIKQMTL